MGWNDVYAQSETVWGEKPDTLLIELAPSIPKGRVLDLGMGEGRNLLPFASQGYDAYGVDESPAAVQKCSERARTSNLQLNTHVGDMREVEIEPDTLTLVICAMSLQFMKYVDSKILLERIKAGLQSGGFVYLTVFSTEDPMLQRLSQTSEPVEDNTYFIAARESYVHFFQREEIFNPCEGLKLNYFAQSISLDPGHPGAPSPHYHGILTYIGQKI